MLWLFLIFFIAKHKSSNGLQCERILAPTCQGLGYNMTALPNLAGHTNQKDAENMVNFFINFILKGESVERYYNNIQIDMDFNYNTKNNTFKSQPAESEKLQVQLIFIVTR